MAVLGKRKTSSEASDASITRDDAEEIFRRHFEAQFAPLTKAETAASRERSARNNGPTRGGTGNASGASNEDDSDDSDDDDGDGGEEWTGISDNETDQKGRGTCPPPLHPMSVG